MGFRKAGDFGTAFIAGGMLIAVAAAAAGGSLGGSRIRGDDYARMNPELAHLDRKRKMEFPFKPVLAGIVIVVIGMALTG